MQESFKRPRKKHVILNRQIKKLISMTILFCCQVTPRFIFKFNELHILHLLFFSYAISCLCNRFSFFLLSLHCDKIWLYIVVVYLIYKYIYCVFTIQKLCNNRMNYGFVSLSMNVTNI